MMDKLTYALMTLVVLCVLPIYSELRSVKEKMNFNEMKSIEEGGDVLNTQIHSIRDGRNVPLTQPRRQKQTLQGEKRIRNSVKQDVKAGKGSIQNRKTLQPNKHLVNNPNVNLHKIKESYNPILPIMSRNFDKREDETLHKDYENIQESEDENEDEDMMDVPVSKEFEYTDDYDEEQDATVSKSEETIIDNTQLLSKKGECISQPELSYPVSRDKLPKKLKSRKKEVCEDRRAGSKIKNKKV